MGTRPAYPEKNKHTLHSMFVLEPLLQNQIRIASLPINLHLANFGLMPSVWRLAMMHG